MMRELCELGLLLGGGVFGGFYVVWVERMGGGLVCGLLVWISVEGKWGLHIVYFGWIWGVGFEVF